MINVLIADDHAIVRAGLRTLLNEEPSLKLVGEASGGIEAIELVNLYHPDILLLDLSMPDLDGMTVTKRLKQSHPDTRILILTVHQDEGMLREAIRSGASGYILKQAAETELISAIHILLRGDLYVDPVMMRSVFTDNQHHKQDSPSKIVEPLTPRETDVLILICQGYTNRQIGEELHISVRTVEGHRANLSDKLGLQNRVELVRFAKEHGIID